MYANVETYVIIIITLPLSAARKGVSEMHALFDFGVAVFAGVVAYYICKLLDRR